MHGACCCASQTPRVPLHQPCKARCRVGAHLSKLWPYTRNWVKSRVWALFQRWALFHETTVHTLYMYADKTASKRERRTHNQLLHVVCMSEYQWMGLCSLVNTVKPDSNSCHGNEPAYLCLGQSLLCCLLKYLQQRSRDLISLEKYSALHPCIYSNRLVLFT